VLSYTKQEIGIFRDRTTLGLIPSPEISRLRRRPCEGSTLT